MTQLLHTALEEALKQPSDVQDQVAKAMFSVLNAGHRMPRPIGLADGTVHVPDNFNDPLPDEELAAWYGESSDDPLLDG